MGLFVRRLAALALVMGAAFSSATAAPQAADESAEALIQRTKAPSATYSLYQWAVQRGEEGQVMDAWFAEFNSGDWHRVERPMGRAIANCRTHMGYIYIVETGEIRANDQVWITACGVSTFDQILSADRLPAITMPGYGKLDMLKVGEARTNRLYAIDRNGILIRAQWTATNGSPSPCMQIEPIAMQPKLPAKDMFTPESLKRSFMPEKYMTRPKDFPAAGLAGHGCG